MPYRKKQKEIHRCGGCAPIQFPTVLKGAIECITEVQMEPLNVQVLPAFAER